MAWEVRQGPPITPLFRWGGSGARADALYLSRREDGEGNQTEQPSRGFIWDTASKQLDQELRQCVLAWKCAFATRLIVTTHPPPTELTNEDSELLFLRKDSEAPLAQSVQRATRPLLGSVVVLFCILDLHSLVCYREQKPTVVVGNLSALLLRDSGDDCGRHIGLAKEPPVSHRGDLAATPACPASTPYEEVTCDLSTLVS
jgi:hypothetical protein